MSQKADMVDRLLDPVGQALTAEVAQRLLSLRADEQVQSRVDLLAERANEGTITPEERAEYEACIAASNFIAILQRKARAVLAPHAA